MSPPPTVQTLLCDGIVAQLDEQGKAAHEKYLTKLRAVTQEAQAAGDQRYVAWMMALAKLMAEMDEA